MECLNCLGTGKVETIKPKSLAGFHTCKACKGSGKYTPSDPNYAGFTRPGLRWNAEKSKYVDNA